MKNQIVEIKKLGINGEGIGYIDRKIIFIKGALVGEEVEVEIVQQNKSFYEGKLVKVIKVSPARITPKCPQEKECYGCSLLHLNYKQQLIYKKEAIRESLRKYTNYNLNDSTFKDVIENDKLDGFITSINVPVVDFKRRITFGIYQRESKYLTVLTTCFKQDPLINKCLKDLEEILTTSGVKTYSDKFRTGLRFLKLKMIDQKIQLVFITGRNKLEQSVIDKISQLEYVVSVFISVNTSRHQDFDELGYSKLYGHTRLELRDDKNKYIVSVKSRLPENLNMYYKKNQVITSMLANSKKIVSLNCGLGILELNLDGKEVVAVDEKKYHIDDCKLNAKYLNKEHVNFICGDIDDKIVSYAKSKTYDTFVIQNERYGISERIKDSIILSKVDNVIYSCDSHSTLAKDLADLEKYYSLERIVALDVQSYTPYVTTIVKLKRK